MLWALTNLRRCPPYEPPPSWDNEMSLKEKTITGVVWAVAQRWGARLFGFVVLFLLARLLGPEDFGLIALATAFIAFADVFVTGAFTAAIVQRDDLEPEHLDTAFLVNLGVGFLAIAVSFVAAPLIAEGTSEPLLAPVIRWLSLSFVLGALSNVQNAVLQRDFAYKSLAMRHLAGVLSGGVIGIAMAFLGFGVWSLVAQQLVTLAVSTAVLWYLSDWRPAFRFYKRHFDELFGFEVNILGSNVLNFFNRRADDLLIGFFLGPVALGFYSLAYRIVYILTELFVSALSEVAFNSFSRMQNDTERMKRNFYNATRLSSLFAFPVFIGLALVSPELISGIFGERWTQSIRVLQILAFMGILQSVTPFNDVVIKASGKSAWVLLLKFISAAINIIGFLIAVRFGITVVAAVLVIRGYLLLPLSLFLVNKLVDLDTSEYLSQYVNPLLSSFVMAAVILLAKYFLPTAHPLLELASYIAIGGATYIAMIRFTSPELYRYAYELFGQAVPGLNRAN